MVQTKSQKAEIDTPTGTPATEFNIPNAILCAEKINAMWMALGEQISAALPDIVIGLTGASNRKSPFTVAANSALSQFGTFTGVGQ